MDPKGEELAAVIAEIRERVRTRNPNGAAPGGIPLADLMLMPSEMESFGLAALEAMACSVPTIATRVGGVPELITDGVNGMLFPMGDVDAMADAAIDLLRDEKRLSAMALAARRTATERFCATKVIPLYEEYYERVLARSAAEHPQTHAKSLLGGWRPLEKSRISDPRFLNRLRALAQLTGGGVGIVAGLEPG